VDGKHIFVDQIGPHQHCTSMPQPRITSPPQNLLQPARSSRLPLQECESSSRGSFSVREATYLCAIQRLAEWIIAAIRPDE